MKQNKLFQKIAGIVAAAALAVTSFAAGVTLLQTATAEGNDPTPLNLYNAANTTITSASLDGTNPYFGKPATITLGTGEDAATYSNVLQTLVKGPFEASSLGMFYSALTYDIEGMGYNYFTVTVGNNNWNSSEGYTNHLLYKVMVDGQVLAQSTHALAAFEVETLSCTIPETAKEIRLHAQSEEGTAHGESNWANPVLSVFNPNGKMSLTAMPVSGISTSENEEYYHIGSATLAQDTDQALTDANAIIGAIHGDYGNNTWKFSADYDISVKNFTRFTVDAGMLFGTSANETNYIWYKVVGFNAAGGVYELGRSEAMTSLTYHHFDITIPEGTVRMQLWAQSSSNTKAWGNIAWCNATLYYADTQITPVQYGALTAAEGELVEGNALPAVSGAFRSGKATIPGTVEFDAGQILAAGTKAYNWTFTPADTVGYAKVTGTLELTARALTDEEILAKQEFNMVKGASVRMDANSGIRFSAFFSKALVEEWEAKGYEVELGMLIAPTEYITNEKGALSLTNANYVVGTDYKQIVCNVCSVIDGYYRINGVLRVKTENYGAAFTGLGYIKLTKGDTVLYKYAAQNENSRTIKYVAQAALDEGGLTSDQEKVLKAILGVVE